MTAETVESLCRLHFAPPHFAFLTQVRNGTGFQRRRTRTADALAMGTWPSRGIHLHGIEIKVSHSDFLAELKNPEKAEEIAQYCHYWWLAVSGVGVAPLAEVPENWGLLVADEEGAKLKVIRSAIKKDAKSPDHLLLAAIMRKVSEEFIHKGDLDDWKGKLRVELETTATRNAATQRGHLVESYERIQKSLATVESALGCRINEWSVGSFAQTFKLAKKLEENGQPTVAAIRRLLSLVKQFEPELNEAADLLSPKKEEAVV